MDDPLPKLDRRTFLQTGAEAGALVLLGVACGPGDEPPRAPAPTPNVQSQSAASAQPSPPPAPDAPPLKLGLIGCGEQGRFLMSEALKIPGNEFTALCDIDPANLRAAQEIAAGKAKTFTDYNQMLKEGGFEGVIIATPLHLHYPIAKAALESGKHVFVERMMADTIGHCKELLRLCVEKEKVLLVGNHLRYHPTYQDAYKFIANGEVGKVQSVTIYWRQKSLRRKPAAAAAAFDPTRFGYAGIDQLLNWRLYKEHSGGVMTEEINDQLDAVNLMLGENAFPVSFSGKGATAVTDGRTVIDDVDLTYQYPDGVTLRVQSMLDENFTPAGWEVMETVDGTKGRLVLAQFAGIVGVFAVKPEVEPELWYNLALKTKAITDPKIIPADSKEVIVLGKPTPGVIFIAGFDVADLLDPKSSQPLKDSYHLELLDFRRSILNKGKPTADAFTGLKSAVLSLLGLEAIEKGQPVAITPAHLEL